MTEVPFLNAIKGITVVCFFFFTNAFTHSVKAQFVSGADIGWLAQMEASGYKFYDSAGEQKNCLQILKDKGINIGKVKAVPGGKGLGVIYWEPEGAKCWSGYQLSCWGADEKMIGSSGNLIRLDLLPGIYLVNVDVGQYSVVEKLIVR